MQFKNIIALFAILFLVASCERDTTQLPIATNYPTTPDVFLDGFSSGLKFDAWGKVTAFDVDYTVNYKGTASMKFEVPNANDPAGNFAGGVFYTSMPRDLSGYDALTFWAKATTITPMNASFGSYPESQAKFVTTFQVGMEVKLTTTWQKFIIPIPDPSKLNKERGMFSYSAGALSDGLGYTIWVDEVKFEKLGTLAHPKILISNASSWPTSSGFVGQTYNTNVVMSVNLPSGVFQEVNVPASYLTFTSSDSNVASVDEAGLVTVKGTGTANITANLGDISTTGKITLTKAVPMAPTPLQPAANVISLFSDAYPNVSIDTPKWDYVTNILNIFPISGNNIMSFSKFSYLPITFANMDASAMTHLHFDIYVVAPQITNQPVKLVLKDAVGGEKSITNSAGITTGSWKSLDIPLSNFGLSQKSALQFLIIAADPQSPKMTDLYLDNVYFYKN
ncbi:MAG: hypothetical protein AUK44_05635 [Porphyromonadaceae bacterium CG2_30_38_12]|nr:MAG: hypothetical protein AUK44_05635 [Porphyromonadaceae bacterium CG2_30_38_12]